MNSILFQPLVSDAIANSLSPVDEVRDARYPSLGLPNVGKVGREEVREGPGAWGRWEEAAQPSVTHT